MKSILNKLNILAITRIFNNNRALDIAVKHKTHVDTVLGFRERYMKKCNKKETNKKFLQFAQGVRNNSF